jgi:integrase
MASLRRFPRSPFWFACFSLPDGKRVQKSTKESSRKRAQAKADQWETLSKDRAKARQAHKIIAEIYKSAHSEELPDATPRAFIAGWLTRRKGELAPSTLAAYAGRSTHFIEWLAFIADRPLAELDTRQFIAYRDALAGRLSPTTANHAIKLLRVIFEDARRDGFLADNPAKDCGMLKKSAGAKRRAFTLDEIRAVLAVADEEWRSMIFFALYTGQRLKDLASLTWANVDLDAGEVHLITGKTRRMVRIPICSPLMRNIEALPAGDDPKAPLHPRIAGSAEGSTLSRQFGDLLATAGLTDGRKHGGVKDGRSARRSASEISFHSLRHTATSLMKNAGVSPAIVMDIIGHDSAEMSAHYTHIESDAKRKALNATPDLT